MAEYIPYVTVSVDALESQIKVANNRIIRCARSKLDNEYAEGVRDALSWLLGRGTMPFANDESASVEAA